LVALVAVLFQGLLGGLRVVLDKHGLGAEFGVLHAALAQLFFVVICALAWLTSGWWATLTEPSEQQGSWLRYFYLAVTVLIFGQLMLGAAMRHQHAGLAIPDFPLAYGKVWPAMDEASVAAYNSQRVETVAYNSITSFQIGLQMAHRLVAGLILVAVVFAFALTRLHLPANSSVKKLSTVWLGLISLQVLLGAATVWTNKSVIVATGHVAVGALSLMIGSMLAMVSFRLVSPVRALGRVSEGGTCLTRGSTSAVAATTSE
ncbi:MAG: COX15/CtaA family protein, partial [Opitutaceae bacterium]|nr:COX15/CtaA family protein [Verrucomicrobiales bacterium]